MTDKQVAEPNVCAEVMYAQTLKKKTKFWIVLSILSLIYVFSHWGVSEEKEKIGKHVAEVTVGHPIESLSENWYKQLQMVAQSDDVEALVLVLDSPGGVVHVAEAGYSLLQRIRKKIPIITIVKSQAASAAYLMACATDVILAQETSLVGSIGVISSVTVVKDLLNKIGVQYTTNGQGKNLSGIPFQGLNDFTKKYLYLEGQDSYTWFKGIVKTGRRFNDQQLARVTEGRIFLGSDALGLGLIDGFGGLAEANYWLQRAKGINSDNSLLFVDYNRYTA
ncbi:MAG: S49 family peptidase [Pseudomonadota bacterium]|nr:S49 family peptidase [Pseudomonadota bacterium]